MKKLMIIILAICVILPAGCRSDISAEAPLETQSATQEPTWQEVIPIQQTDVPEETTLATEERSETEHPTQAVSPEPTPLPSEDVPVPPETEPQEQDPPPATEPSELEPMPPAAEVTSPTDPPEPTEPEEPKATAADAGAIAAKLVEYLNAYRIEQGYSQVVVLPGLTQYAEYRSRQLVSNFAHDTLDERAAATALEYGSYIDPAVYGMTGDPYYAANAREAIAKTDFGGSIDAVAARLARMVRNSSSHWSYVGSSGYTYIGVGITYNNGVWYCDIAVADSNTDTQ